jgi:formate hydrogenlyase transcriptional activator
VDDIPLLVEYLIDRYAKKAGKKIKTITKKTLDLLRVYDWPGNVRELQNVVERAVILSDGETFSVDETWLKAASSQEPSRVRMSDAGLSRDIERERALIEAALVESGGRVSGPAGAATKLGIPRQTLDSKIRSLRIDKHRLRHE